MQSRLIFWTSDLVTAAFDGMPPFKNARLKRPYREVLLKTIF